MKSLSSTSLVLPLALALATAVRADDKLPDTPYYPLKVGTTWSYKINDTRFSMKVARYEKIDKQLCARVEMSVDEKVQAVEHVVAKDDGVYRYAYNNKKAEPPVRFFKLPPRKGETWKVKSTIGKESVSGDFKSGVVDRVKVPAGTYKNVYTSSSDNLDANGTKMTFVYYFARDVGMVKQTIKIAGVETVIELERFEAGK